MKLITRVLGVIFFTFSLWQAHSQQVIFSEVMYNPAAGKAEWIEVSNIANTPYDIADWKFTDGIEFTFPPYDAAAANSYQATANNPISSFAHILRPMERIIVTDVTPAAFRAEYPNLAETVRVFGPWTGALDNGGERITLRDRNGVIVETLRYNDRGDWPRAADGTGHSLTIINENKQTQKGVDWRASFRPGGSPGYGESSLTKVLAKPVENPTDLPTATNEFIITEIFPGPGNSFAFVELYNPGATPINLQGLYSYAYLQLAGAAPSPTTSNARQITDAIIIPAQGYAVLPFPITDLSYTSSDIQSSFGNVLFFIFYRSNGQPTPTFSPITGVKVDLRTQGQSHSRQGLTATSPWVITQTPTPKQANAAPFSSQHLRLSEVQYASSTIVAVEVYNSSSSPINLSPYRISASNDLSNPFSLTGTLAPGAALSVAVNFPVAANQTESTLYLFDQSNTVIHALDFPRSATLPFAQVYPHDSFEVYLTSTGTPNAVNNPARHTDIVINEIMFDPPSKHRDGEFIELYNKSANEFDLTGWRITGDVSYTFPVNSRILPKSYLVIAANKSFFQQSYGTTTLHEFTGDLGNKSGKINLRDNNNNLVDTVTYYSGGAWPEASSGGGSSLELVHPDMDNSLPSAWRASDESTKSTLQSYSITGAWKDWRIGDQGNPGTPTSVLIPFDRKEINLWLNGAGHVLLENIKVTKPGITTNMLSNPNVLANNVITTNVPLASDGSKGWLARGNHWRSTVSANGQLQLISSSGGENKANLVECDIISNLLDVNDVITISFQARWISGSNRLIVQTLDQSVGKALALPIPQNLGTPGANNSRAQTLPATQVTQLKHEPAVPRTTTPIVISAKVSTEIPLSTVEVFHRVDNTTFSGDATDWNALTMNDLGTNGDAVAGDKIYSATLPSANYNVANRIAQYYVKTTAANGQILTEPAEGPNQPFLLICDDANTPQELRFQRIIISAYNRAALNFNGTQNTHKFRFPRLSNEFFPCAFIHNEVEVYQRTKIRNAGSPWTRNVADLPTRGAIEFPGDNPFRDATRRSYDNSFNERSPAAGGNDFFIRYWLYLMGETSNQSEPIRQKLNGSTISFIRDVEPTNEDLVDRLYEDGSKGDLFAVEDGWWLRDFDDDNRTFFDADWNYDDPKKNSDEPYRWHNEYSLRSDDIDYDYGALLSMIKLIDDDTFSEEQLDNVLDLERLAANTAVRGYAADWDSFMLERGKNAFLYRPPGSSKFRFLQWDSDQTYQANRQTQFFVTNERNVQNVVLKPYFMRRLYNQLFYLDSQIAINPSFNDLNKRSLIWLDVDDDISAVYNSGLADSYYRSFIVGNTARHNQMINLINQGYPTDPKPTTATFTVTNPVTSVTSNPVTLTGNVNIAVSRITIDGHPEIKVNFINNLNYEITGLILAEGVNNLTLRQWSNNGVEFGAPINLSITKTGNTVPFINVSASPASYSLVLGESILLDASGSRDPEGGALTYTWSISPSANVQVGTPSPSQRRYMFSQAGIYVVTVRATDTAGLVAETTREIVVANRANYHSFGTGVLDAALVPANTELRDNFSPNSWWSLEDDDGRLRLQMISETAMPMTNAAFTHPAMRRNLPANTEWAMQTEVRSDARLYGNYMMGLMLDTTQGGAPVRYYLGLDGGTKIAVKKISAAGSVDLFAALPTTDVSPDLRIQRLGSSLRFYSGGRGIWTLLGDTPLLGDTVIGLGGPYVASTTSATSARGSFDYLIVVDPTQNSGLVGSLRITEIMYNPKVNTEPEFIELQNVGSAAINLNGLKFTDGNPFSQVITLGNVTLNPGQFGVITRGSGLTPAPAFTAKYGSGVNIIGTWPNTGGSLSNGGERIQLLDASGNEIHDFEYDNVTPWPTTPDGQGPSLEITDITGNYNDGTNWHASYEIGGTPGRAGAGVDRDGDGLPDKLEALFGTDPNNAASNPTPKIVKGPGDTWQISWPTVSGRIYTLQESVDLVTWTNITPSVTATSASSMLSVTSTSTRRFFRATTPIP